MRILDAVSFDAPMGKKRRARPDRRNLGRPVNTAPSTMTRADYGAPATREPIRPRFTRAGGARATGEPSQPLLRAATLEYGFVTKDMRRIAFTGAGAILVLALATVVVDFFFR